VRATTGGLLGVCVRATTGELLGVCVRAATGGVRATAGEIDGLDARAWPTVAVWVRDTTVAVTVRGGAVTCAAPQATSA
jgi:hypothetical protein